jgi:putative chitinase
MDAATLAEAAHIPADRAFYWIGHIEEAAIAYQINTAPRLAAFLAQVCHETGGLRHWVENLNYSTPERIASVFVSPFRPRQTDLTDIEDMLDAGQMTEAEAAAEKRRISVDMARPFARNPQALANFVYANRGGNGPEESGDGWRYRGRGLIQITFRDNYVAAAHGLGIPCDAEPELLEREAYAAISAGWWWYAHGLNAYADRGQIDSISGIINRGSPHKGAEGAQHRAAAYRHALAVLSL